MALVSESWASASRPMISGVMSAALNAGILLLSQIARHVPITADSWQWIFHFAGFPAALGVFTLLLVPESPAWLASRNAMKNGVPPLRVLFRREMVRITCSAMLLSAIPMVGAWAASKWMIPWADSVAGNSAAGYKAATQGWWALGATLGSFAGAHFAHMLGRRFSYALISVGAAGLTVAMFQLTAPLQPSFHPVVLAQGFVSTLFFGWLALFLPAVFPIHVRATGTGLAYNAGRFATAFGVLAAGGIFTLLGGSYPKVGAICASVYALGLLAVMLAPTEETNNFPDSR